MHEEVESRLICPECHGVPFVIYRKQTRPGSDIYINDLRVGNDGNHEIPEDRRHLKCPNCDIELTRE